MNDFSKEELTLLEDCIIIAISEFNVEKPIYTLQDKVHSMIENYCDHKFVVEIIIENDECLAKSLKCIICRKLFTLV